MYSSGFTYGTSHKGLKAIAIDAEIEVAEQGSASFGCAEERGCCYVNC